jgi:hypothetical protein
MVMEKVVNWYTNARKNTCKKTFQKSKTVAWIQKEQYKISATDEIRFFGREELFGLQPN